MKGHETSRFIVRSWEWHGPHDNKQAPTLAHHFDDRMRYTSLGLLALVLTSATAYHALMEDGLHSVPNDWVLQGAADPAKPIKLTLFLEQHDIPTLEAKLNAVSDPDSPLYGQVIPLDEIHSLSRAIDGAADAVKSWLDRHNVASKHVQWSAQAGTCLVAKPSKIKYHSVQILLASQQRSPSQRKCCIPATAPLFMPQAAKL